LSALITPEMARALKEKRPLAALVELDHPDGLVRAWSGIGTLRYNGEDWYGLGIFGDVGPMVITTETVIQEITYSLSGIEPDQEELQFLNAFVRGRSGRQWLAALDEQGRVIKDPYELPSTRLDYQTQDVDDDGTAKVSVLAYAGFYTLERSIDECWTAEDQRKRYPNDSGFDLITSLTGKDIIWTRT